MNKIIKSENLIKRAKSISKVMNRITMIGAFKSKRITFITFCLFTEYNLIRFKLSQPMLYKFPPGGTIIEPNYEKQDTTNIKKKITH